jgi:hypothetical protein
MMNGGNFRKKLKLKLDHNPILMGLEGFKRRLEKDYFASVTVRNCASDFSDFQPGLHPYSLVIEMECNFDLIEIFSYLEKGNWGRPSRPENGNGMTGSAFNEAFVEFNNLNSLETDVEEFSLVCRDTSIVIKKLYSQSVPEQFGQILQTLAAHYVYFTRDLTETPYEIYLPVFEEEITASNSLVSTVKRDNSSAKDYYSYWALYFESMSDARIYDISRRTIISGDLHMLNH